MRVIVHGGAGGGSTTRPTEADDRPDGPTETGEDTGVRPGGPADRQSVLDEAAETGAAAETVTDAVCAAVGVLESDPRFNAGVGSTVQSDGIARTDAGLMTDGREVGAACAMPGVERAVEVARIVKEETPHVLVVGVHAVDLAAAFGVETGVDLRTDARREQWNRLDDVPAVTSPREQLDWLRDRFDGPASHDTVGAVAHDGDRVAAATSTGGRWLALAGRVGDVPQVGAGFYCGRVGGASATGDGEDIARVTLARRAVDHLERGRDARAAAELAVEELEDLTGGGCGVIVARNDGDVGHAYNTGAMQTSVADDA